MVPYTSQTAYHCIIYYVTRYRGEQYEPIVMYTMVIFTAVGIVYQLDPFDYK